MFPKRGIFPAPVFATFIAGSARVGPETAETIRQVILTSMASLRADPKRRFTEEKTLPETRTWPPLPSAVLVVIIEPATATPPPLVFAGEGWARFSD